METLSGKSIDGSLLATLRTVMGSYPIGTMVRLTSMEVGLVTGVGPDGHGPIRISVIVDRHGHPLPRPEEMEITEIDKRIAPPGRSILGTVNPLLYPNAQKEALLQASPS
jgi:hypothetical protein